MRDAPGTQNALLNDPLEGLRQFSLTIVRADPAEPGWLDLDGLTLRQLAILLTVCTEPAPQTVRGLALHLKIGKPVVSRSVNRLADMGLAARLPDPEDRRSVDISPTPAGIALVRSMSVLTI